jgi:hypothetical protein
MKILGPEGRGSVGNTTTSRNTFALYTRARNGRGGFGDPVVTAAVAGWQANTHQAAWEAFARQFPEPNSLGVSRPLSGYLAYIRQSIWSQLFATAPLDAPVYPPSRLPVTDPLLTDPTVFLTWNGIGPAWVIIEVSGWETTGVTRPPGRGKYWKTVFRQQILASGAYSGSQSLEATMIGTYGLRPLTGRVYARLHAIDPTTRTKGATARTAALQF